MVTGQVASQDGFRPLTAAECAGWQAHVDRIRALGATSQKA